MSCRLFYLQYKFIKFENTNNFVFEIKEQKYEKRIYFYVHHYEPCLHDDLRDDAGNENTGDFCNGVWCVCKSFAGWRPDDAACSAFPFARSKSGNENEKEIMEAEYGKLF